MATCQMRDKSTNAGGSIPSCVEAVVESLADTSAEVERSSGRWIERPRKIPSGSFRSLYRKIMKFKFKL